MTQDALRVLHIFISSLMRSYMSHVHQEREMKKTVNSQIRVEKAFMQAIGDRTTQCYRLKLFTYLKVSMVLRKKYSYSD